MTTDYFTWPIMDHGKGTWFGSEELKAWTVDRMVQHRANDELAQGTYQELAKTPGGHKGCLIGCTLPYRGSNSRYQWGYTLPGVGFVQETGDREQDVEAFYGIDLAVAQLLEAAFENTDPFEAAAEFAVESIEAIPVGVRYPKVGPGWPDSHRLPEVLEFLRTAGVPA